MTEPYYSDSAVTLHHGDCIEVMRELADCSVDAIATDPPYGLGFMGRAWDALPPGEEWARECLRVLKPGGHLLAFGGTRTWHRLAVAVEDAGFEIRDSIAWLYGSGFPKSLDVSKAIDKMAGAEREVVGFRPQFPDGTRGARARPNASSGVYSDRPGLPGEIPVTAPATEAAQQWAGWGTALKPAFEPVVVARKPLSEGTVAANVLEHGTGALNIDATRIESDGGHKRPFQPTNNGRDVYGTQTGFQPTNAAGRFPANVVLDADSAAALDEQSGEQRDGTAVMRNGGGGRIGSGLIYSGASGEFDRTDQGYGGSGGASRYFYTAKAGTDERITHNGVAHPTVKPLSLMRWLVRLVTPPGGLILEPFAGSGTTVEAALLEGFRCVAIERETDYLPLIVQRINRRRDPVAYLSSAGEDMGLFGPEDAA